MKRANGEKRLRQNNASTRVGVLVLSVLAGCSRGTTASESVYFAGAIVHGRVVSGTGTPVGGAVVRALAYDASCRGNVYGSGPDMDATDSDGRFSQLVKAVSPGSYCVQVSATVVDGSQQGTIAVFPVTFRSVVSQPFDSTRADITLR